QLVGDQPGAIARDREGDARRLRAPGPRGQSGQGRDPNETGAQVYERTTRVARVDLGAGLDRVGQGSPALALVDHPAQRTDHAGGHAALEAEGVADRDHRLPDLQVGRVTEGDRLQPGAVDLDHGDVVGRERADQGAGELPAAGGGDADGGRAP